MIGVGIAMPGPIQRRTGLTGRACTLKPWVGLDPRLLAEHVLGLPVHAGNDANLAALAEMTWGAARGLRDYAYIYTATGIGAGFVMDGRLYVGANGTAGEIGHTTINEDGLVCACGGRGCLNTLANPDAITEQLWQSHGRRPSIGEVIALAHEGDAGCRRVLADAGRHIGVAMANMYNLLDPELIVLGGSLAPAGDILIEPLRQSMCAARSTPGRPSQTSSPVRSVSTWSSSWVRPPPCSATPPGFRSPSADPRRRPAGRPSQPDGRPAHRQSTAHVIYGLVILAILFTYGRERADD